MTQRPLFARIATLLSGIVLAGCSSGAPQPYALSYQEALTRYPGSETVTPDAVERFVEFFSAEPSSADTAGASARRLYADRLYFSDTLLTSEDKAQIVRHLTRMHESTESLSVTVLDTQRDGADFYVVWKMTAQFAPVRSTVTSHSIGVTHLRFDAEQRIVLQQDFWDASAGFYEHVPMLGAAIRTIAGTFNE